MHLSRRKMYIYSRRQLITRQHAVTWRACYIYFLGCSISSPMTFTIWPSYVYIKVLWLDVGITICTGILASASRNNKEVSWIVLQHKSVLIQMISTVKTPWAWKLVIEWCLVLKKLFSWRKFRCRVLWSLLSIIPPWASALKVVSVMLGAQSSNISRCVSCEHAKNNFKQICLGKR